ncbi:PhzF family phenazine biosynthesis protein [Massilia sp. TS11]|uniref:PhzF family phenazine biosynthesis protein n=1 Tax=Massilia sp. TS11 TaxID=2908003 RepID=UPI001ED9E866|nr:PhzF family phenazine biosynthesis protein [Massilia sp. TS11]MCG2585207.1 PhzF family phenazine biosynthesis protein [Massilia sp. TS11]
MPTFTFTQVDVFTSQALLGNPVAVVHGAAGLSTEQMQTFARWTNLSETTFLLPPTQAGADYRLRIFTPGGELPFAGHPTLGSCHAWLEAGGQPADPQRIVQECEVGLVPIRRDAGRLAFGAPPLRRSGPLSAPLLVDIADGLGIAPDAIRGHQWVDNGPGWCAVMLASAEEVRALQPDFARLAQLRLGVVGPQAPGAGTDFEVRAFVVPLGVPEDPVTGSLNAGLAQWLIGAGLAPSRYVAAQGSALGRAGRVHVECDGADIWVGGDTVSCIRGSLTL